MLVVVIFAKLSIKQRVAVKMFNAAFCVRCVRCVYV